MEALAVYERPVTPAAIDYLLQPYLPGINSAPVLNRLVNMQFVRKEGNRITSTPLIAPTRSFAFPKATNPTAAPLLRGKGLYPIRPPPPRRRIL